MKPTSYGQFRLKTLLRQAVRTFVVLFTIGYSAIEGLTFFAEEFDRVKLASMAIYVGVILIVALARGFTAQRQLRELRIEIGNEREIRIVVDDFMSNVRRFADASCVFGVNDQFAVVGLKPDSVHAAFLKEYFSHNDEAQNQAEQDRVLVGSGLTGQTMNSRHPRVLSIGRSTRTAPSLACRSDWTGTAIPAMPCCSSTRRASAMVSVEVVAQPA